MDKQPLATNSTATTTMDQTAEHLHSGTIHPQSWRKVKKDMDTGTLQRE